MELGVPNTTIFLPNDYNGEAQNFDFIQDDKGVLYIANTVGFLEFNGNKWRSFKPENDGVPLSFVKDKSGRITQELLNNIIKHSKASEVSVQLFNANNNIILIVEDNGVGFSTGGKKNKGIGLLNISSRLDMVNGNVNFEPSPKSGTLVTIKIPI